jgi:hypothetical protein
MFQHAKQSKRKPPTEAEEIKGNTAYYWGTRWRSWLRHYATSQKVAGSISDGVIGIFH